MHDLGDDLTLRFHAMKIGDVPKTDDNAFDPRQIGVIACRSLEPAPAPVLASQAAAPAKLSIAADCQNAKAFASCGGIVCVDKVNNRSSG